MLNESDLSNVADRTNETPPGQRVPSAHEKGKNRDFGRVVLFALVQPVVVAVIVAVLLNRGVIHQCCLEAGLLSWASVIAIVLRQVSDQRARPTRLESWIAKYGFWAAFLGLWVVRLIRS
jgi:hypothetical protein